jgi:hypothetical protein
MIFEESFSQRSARKAFGPYFAKAKAKNISA